ncbi:sulfotransferase [Pseudoxanthobacter sp. M-2]|uniref:sulfotransferase family protein n=1 Tax=Pseudoxanthobacter sp. M-2 TaxID=3078754 RepID=UPI0038FBE64C
MTASDEAALKAAKKARKEERRQQRQQLTPEERRKRRGELTPEQIKKRAFKKQKQAEKQALPRADEQPDFKVGFLVAGVQKGGTSTLHAYLERHRQIGLGGSKELHFFDDETQDWDAPDYRRYHRLFPVYPDAAIAGECTPVYFFWPPSLGRIHAYSPDVRFIVVFRNPIDRAFSQWAMAYARGEDGLLFEEAIRGGRQRVADAGDTGHSQRVHSYVERGFYGAQMRRFLTLYPREQILPLTSEELFKSHRSALAKVTAFLGVEPFPDDLEALHVNSKKKRVEYPSVLTRADAVHLADVFRDDLAEFQALTGLDVSGWLDTSRYPD